MMESKEIREKFLKFFEKREHKIIPSASLIPENDPSVLFTTAGMQPLVPYLMGEKYPEGDKLVGAQKCVRTQDIEEIGDNTHTTFFEMLGNWSLGSYFKEDAIKWSYEFLTSKNEGLGLDPERLYITVFKGDENAEIDEESANIWKSLGILKNKIYFLGVDSNWWSAGDSGPCGPDTEIFYDLKPELGEIKNKEDFLKADDQQRVVEIWNNVFMEYEKRDGKVVGKLKQKNVDTGAGLERLSIIIQGKNNIFETDLLGGLMSEIKNISGEKYDEKFARIIADHIRTSVFIISDGVSPSNTDAGYILRRLLRRVIRYADNIGLKKDSLGILAKIVVRKYGHIYKNVLEQQEIILEEIKNEEEKFRKTLNSGLKEFNKLSKNNISGKEAFVLFSTYGLPVEMTQELAKEAKVSVDLGEFHKEMEKHQNLSRTASVGKFKGGLSGSGEMEIKYHTATHLLLSALRQVLGNEVTQKGSNITSERLRFDFSHFQKMTDEEKDSVERIINEKIEKGIPVVCKEMNKEEANKKGIVGMFNDKYCDTVKVYSIGDFSIELCGGPHIKNTSELGNFKIKKEESVSSGVRRIKAVLI